jgi:hypothetical protein
VGCGEVLSTHSSELWGGCELVGGRDKDSNCLRVLARDFHWD